MNSAATRRVGILGGTFDPPHFGHLAAAQFVRTQLGLDEVVLMVANDPWQKSGDRDVTPAAIRLEMVRALVDGVEGLSVSDQEIVRGGQTFTVDTLSEMVTADPSVQLFLIVGQDTAVRIPTWHRPDDLLRLSTLVIVNRASEPTADVRPDGARVMHVKMTPVDVSSTVIRAAVAQGQPISFGTSDGVAKIIAEHHLYGAAQ